MLIAPGFTSIPPHREIASCSFSDAEEGQVVLEGEIGSAVAGAMSPRYDVEFILADDGTAYWDCEMFRGLSGRVQVVKQGDQLIVRQVQEP